MTFFTSDMHQGHRNVIRLCNRPFASLEEMDETLISRPGTKFTCLDTWIQSVV